MAKKLSMIAALTLILCLTPIAVFSKSPYEGYIYDSLRNTPESINGYLYKDSIEGIELNIGSFKEPQDIFVADDDTFYIADSGNDRIVHMNMDKDVLGMIGSEEGEGKLSTPKGVFVTEDGDVFVADTGNQRIVHFDPDGDFVRDFKKPDSSLLDSGFTFTPSRVILDKRGYMFIVSEGAHQGLVQLRPDGSFAGFFGANHVDFSLTRLLVKFIASKEQREQLASVRPPEFSNLFQDEEGFVYTTTFGIRTNQIKRLSAVGVDVLNIDEANDDQRRYGDYYMPIENWSALYEAFVDVTVDRSGVITALDQTTGKAFQYDQLGNLLFIFGGLGDQDGLFMTPASIGQTLDGTMYIVDKTRNRIDRFHTTPFATKVHEATKLYVEGKYEDASEPWQEVIRMNSSYDLAYKAIGKALYKAEHYREAMTYLKVAKDRIGYSEAFVEHRKVFLRKHFELVFAGIIIIYVLYKAITMWIKRRRRAATVPLKLDGGGMIVSITNLGKSALLHPINFFYDIQFKGKSKIIGAVIIILLAVAVRVLSLMITGFSFQTKEPYQISLLMQAIWIIGPWLLWSISNWGVSTIIHGEGKFIDVLSGSAFVFVPYVCFMLPLAIVTNVLTLSENLIVGGVTWFIYLWIAFLVLAKTKIIHDFDLGKAIWITLLTIIGMFIIMFIGLLIFGLVNQAFSFIINLYKEMSFRL